MLRAVQQRRCSPTLRLNRHPSNRFRVPYTPSESLSEVYERLIAARGMWYWGVTRSPTIFSLEIAE